MTRPSSALNVVSDRANGEWDIRKRVGRARETVKACCVWPPPSVDLASRHIIIFPASREGFKCQSRRLGAGRLKLLLSYGERCSAGLKPMGSLKISVANRPRSGCLGLLGGVWGCLEMPRSAYSNEKKEAF